MAHDEIGNPYRRRIYTICNTQTHEVEVETNLKKVWENLMEKTPLKNLTVRKDYHADAGYDYLISSYDAFTKNYRSGRKEVQLKKNIGWGDFEATVYKIEDHYL